MPKIHYESAPMRKDTLKVIDQANTIIEQYAAQGYELTLRQLYYQFVSRDLIPNQQNEYKRLGDIVSKGRRAGLIDWSAIVDRTRNLQSLATWRNPEAGISAMAEQFRYNWWLAQPTYVEVWFEKDALMGVFERVANQYRLPFFSCRGYTSDSEVWSAAQRLRAVQRGLPILFEGWRGNEYNNGEEVETVEPHKRNVVVLHFGDHDPSGLDMTRDIRDRLSLFGAPGVDVRRLALNMDQVEEHEPPPNPAKETDSRFEGYREEYGDESWELDALEPTVLAELVRSEVKDLIEPEPWKQWRTNEKRARAELQAVTDQYSEVVDEFARDIEVDDVDDDDELEIDE